MSTKTTEELLVSSETHGSSKPSRLYRALHLFAPNSSPSPAGSSLDDARLIPEVTAGWLSLLTFNWITPLMSLGYARPLEAPDLYRLQDYRSAAIVADQIVASFEKRLKVAKRYNARLTRGEIKPGLWQRLWWTTCGDRTEREKRWREKDGHRKASLLFAIIDSVKWWYWIGTFTKATGDTGYITSILVVKEIIIFSSQSYLARHNPDLSLKAPPIGRGIGLAFILLALQFMSVLASQHYYYRSAGTGALLRAGLISAIYSRSIRLTTRARSTLTNGKLINHISTDVSRIDFAANNVPYVFLCPLYMVILLVMLLVNLGPSALAGYGLFLLAAPLQIVIMKFSLKIRQESMVWTDKRAKLLQEILGGVKLIKVFSWEKSFMLRISEYRQKEMAYLRSLLLTLSANTSISLALPAMASLLSFITYALSGHPLTPEIIFPSLALFNIMRAPLSMLPTTINSTADAMSALERLSVVFEAEVVEDQDHDPSLPVAVRVENATFTWDSPPPEEECKRARRKFMHRFSKARFPDIQATKEISEKKPQSVFHISNLSFEIPKGILLAIVGPVGTGKSSLLQGLIGEMRKTEGTVTFGGSIAYCSQSAWIQSTTIRENICFGREFDSEKYWNAIRCACLEPDLETFPNGDLTEVGERGITLSGGQKQRVNICRAVYSDTDIQIFDDPLSALDAHVGKAVFRNILQNGSTEKTRILVTHGLHFLPEVDYIFTVVDGQIAERGTYTELIAKEGEFAKFVKEFGSEEAASSSTGGKATDGEERAIKDVNKNSASGAGIMQTEERNVGAVDSSAYRAYFRAANGVLTTPFLLLFLVLFQGSVVMTSFWLAYWQEMKWHRSQAFYMGVYAALSFGQMVGLFLASATLAVVTYLASRHLHGAAFCSVMHAPMSFFETTPLGRIMNRFSKDVDNLDNSLHDSLKSLLLAIVQLVGAIILVSVLLPWFLVPLFFILLLYVFVGYFYRRTAREIKRLDAILRSSLYSHFSESLTGIGTIRAYRESKRFQLDNQKRMDVENRAYWLTFSIERWLTIRIESLGTLLTFSVALLVVGARHTISPALVGLILSFWVLLQGALGFLVRLSARVENDMNCVERIDYYTTSIEQEAAHELPETNLPKPWPNVGSIEFSNAVLSYRPELPVVLKGLSMTIHGGEKIGIVGRTGAGKSSLVTALYRLVELTSGAIKIDDIDISTIGLNDVRNAISIIPQDPLLFSGTVRSNLDPVGLHDDARLWEALKLSRLVDTEKAKSLRASRNDGDSGAVTSVTEFTLDTLVEDEGGNLSVGQRSLVSLARALVKRTKILVLDEATASVDYEMDRYIQDTIAQEFQDRTILCIAHRLRTIISYDRICVLDSGQVAEFGTPTELYNSDGIFRRMCEESSITLLEIKIAVKKSEEN